MPLSQPDFDLLRKAQRGDERAFRIIVETYETPVFNYVLRMVGDRALAEDLTQEIFLRIYQGLAGFSLRCRFTTWLFQVAKNRVLDELRARERKPQSFLTLDDMPPLEVVDAPPERVETIDAVWRAVAALNPDLKMALLLRDVVGLSYTEIADSLEITLATVKWRIFKAREEVQLALAREGVSVEFGAERAACVLDARFSSRSGQRPRAGRARGSPPASSRRGTRRGGRRAVRASKSSRSQAALRVPVTRLADRAGVEEPALAGEVDLGAFLAEGERQLRRRRSGARRDCARRARAASRSPRARGTRPRARARTPRPGRAGSRGRAPRGRARAAGESDSR